MNQVICESCNTSSQCMKNGCLPEGKPVVYYLCQPVFWDMHGDADLPVASFAYVLNHPRLGACEIYRTSKIIAKLSDGTIETRNTIYKPLTLEVTE